MNQRVILVTGANGAMGDAIVKAFLKESADNFVWLAVRERQERAQAVLTEFPGRAAILEMDVTQPADWKSSVEKILARHERVDVLVNNAGRHEDGLLANLSQQAWSGVMAANLDAVFHGCQAVLPAMIARRHGRIINMASLSALLAPAGQANYAAAKAGVVALTQSLAKEVARIGITVNAVCPGYIDTEALTSMSELERKSAQARVPMRRFGKPEEVAAAVRFLACAEAGYITGSVLKVDGGIL